jgi:spore coat polysaccharide biosynthesis predicted glycosyltransferase SpsG
MTSKRRLEIAFDTTGGPIAGVGHVLRSWSLAERLRQHGARVSLVNRPVTTPLLPGPLPRTGAAPDVLVIDRPDTTAALIGRRHRRWPSARIVALDYYGVPVTGLAAVINLNLARVRTNRRPQIYRLGLEYATLRPSFTEYRRCRRPVPASVRRVLVGFGGTDPLDWTVAAVEAVRSATDAGISIEVLSGRAVEPGRLAADGITLHVAVTDPAPLLQRSDLAVIGGGTMMIEAACLGLPALVIPRTADERAFARTFARAGAVCLLRAAPRLPAARLRLQVQRLIADRRARLRMRRAGRALIDGRGADRVARLILRAGALAA